MEQRSDLENSERYTSACRCPSAERLVRLKRRRQFWLQVHLYLGLFAGAVLVLIGLTGSILAFKDEIDTWLNPELYTAQTSEQQTIQQPSLMAMVAAATSAMPPGSKPLNIYYPRQPGLTFIISFAPPATEPGEYEYSQAFVDPATARVTGTRIFYKAANPFENCFIGLMLKLHYNLLLGDMPGVTIVGILAVLLLISVLTGLILWWPLTGKWRQAFTFKRHASRERFNFDLHKIAGVYAALILLAVLLSGVYFNLYDQFLWLVERFSPVTDIWNPHSRSTADATPISPDVAIAIAEKRFPEGRLEYLQLPADKTGAYRLCWKAVPSLHSYVIDARCVVIDQYDGKILVKYDPASGTGGDIFLQWQWPLHSGQAFGMTGRILVLLSGLACPVLVVTGVIRWLQKRRANKPRVNPPALSPYSSPR